MIEIREATAADRDRVDEVSRLAFEELRRIYRPSAAALSSKDALELARTVAVDRHAGIIGTIQHRFEAPHLHLIGLAVHPGHRRCGIARLLVEHLVDIARAREVAIVSLYTVKQTGNAAIFERLGFRTIREETDGWSIGLDGEPMTDVYMERAIR